MSLSSTPPLTGGTSSSRSVRLWAQQAGSFFNPVPQDDKNDENDSSDDKEPEKPTAEEAKDTSDSVDPFESNIIKLLRERKGPSLASQPSTINGVPTAGQGFGKPPKKGSEKPYVAIGPKSLNDPRKPEYDDQGYTLYANEETGEKSRVFEALVEYPCDFTLKIVGANEGNFIEEMVAIVAESCQVSIEKVPYSHRALGKWLSVTVQAPVQSAEMLYQLYENVGT